MLLNFTRPGDDNVRYTTPAKFRPALDGRVDLDHERVFGAFGTTAALLGLFSTILAGYLGEHVHVVTILNVQGLGYVVTGILALVFLKRYYDTRPISVTPAQTAELQTEHS